MSRIIYWGPVIALLAWGLDLGIWIAADNTAMEGASIAFTSFALSLSFVLAVLGSYLVIRRTFSRYFNVIYLSGTLLTIAGSMSTAVMFSIPGNYIFLAGPAMVVVGHIVSGIAVGLNLHRSRGSNSPES